MIATRSASPSIDRALECAAAGWYVFPASKSKTPRLRAEFTFDFRPVLAPWADRFIMDNGAGRFRMEEGKAGSYLGSRDARTIRATFAAASVSSPCRIGITSDRLVIDVDAPHLVPAEIQPYLDELPNCPTPGGGVHYFARGGSHFRVGAFRAPDGEKIGDIKHLQLSYSIAYRGIPAYDECDVQTDPRVYEWLADSRKVSAPAAGRSLRVVGGYADLRPSTYTDGDAVQPSDMPDTGRHDVMRDGTMFDAVRGVDRREEWTQALTAAGRDPRVAAQEVDRAYAGAVARVDEIDDLRAQVDAAESRARMAEAKVAEMSPAPATSARFAYDAAGLTDALRSRGWEFGRNTIDGDYVCRQDGGEWMTAKRRDSAGRHRALYDLEMHCHGPSAEPYRLANKAEDRVVVVTFVSVAVTVDTTVQHKYHKILEWARNCTSGYFTFGEVLFAVEGVDRYVGKNNVTRADCRLVRAALESLGWTYRYTDLGGERRGERWACPRQDRVRLT